MANSNSINRAKLFKKTCTVIQYTLAIIVTLIILFPLFWMLISSVKSADELLAPVPTFWPQEWHFENYSDVLKIAPFGLYYFNTIVMTAGIMVLQLGLGIFAAYGFAKGDFKGRNFLFVVVLGALMIPIQVTFVPIYVLCARMNWINTFAGLIIPNAVSAYFIFMLRQTFMSVDNSYLEAARVDGMGRIGIIFRILCPMCKPTIVTVTIITFIDGWNSYFWPKIVTTNETHRTVSIGVTMLRTTFAGMQTSNNNQIMAGAVIAIVPIVILFAVLQKYLLTGFSKAAMK
ncbi:MAG: carbohydrate ABC transporter permease [Angelakisella sp.]